MRAQPRPPARLRHLAGTAWWTMRCRSALIEVGKFWTLQYAVTRLGGKSTELPDQQCQIKDRSKVSNLRDYNVRFDSAKFRMGTSSGLIYF